MPHRPILVLIALFFAIGVSLIDVVRKRRAAASLGGLLNERFVERPCPVGEVVVPCGGRVHCYQAYGDSQGSGIVLVLGTWARGTVRVGGGPVSIDNRVAGLFHPGSEAAWLGRVRTRRDVIVATTVEGGALAIWKGLPSRDSVLAKSRLIVSALL